MEQFVLKNQGVRDAIKAKQIVTMKADVTKYNQEAYELISRLDNEAQTIPYFALFPRDDPNHPRLHPDLFTAADMLDFLAEMN